MRTTENHRQFWEDRWLTAVTAHVDARCRDGVFRESRSGCRGMMVWAVDKRIAGRPDEG